MGLGDVFQQLFWGRRDPESIPWRRPARPRRPSRAAPPRLGQRVALRQPIASAHRVWIPEGATGIVVGGDPRARQVSVELDTPRTVITVPWAWVEDEPDEPDPPPTSPDPTPPA